jgi:protein CpxP
MSRLTRNLTLSAIAATLLSVSTAYAAAGDTPPSGGHDHRGSSMMQHKLDKIHSQLNLNASQEQLWQTALSTMKADRQQERALHGQAKKQMESLMQAPVLDMHALQTQHEQTWNQSQQLRAHTQAAWLNVYDALDPTQKATVSSAFKAQWQRMAERRAKWEHRGSAPAPQ